MDLEVLATLELPKLPLDCSERFRVVFRLKSWSLDLRQSWSSCLAWMMVLFYGRQAHTWPKAWAKRKPKAYRHSRRNLVVQSRMKRIAPSALDFAFKAYKMGLEGLSPPCLSHCSRTSLTAADTIYWVVRPYFFPCFWMDFSIGVLTTVLLQ